MREFLREKFAPVITLLLCSVLIGASIGFAARAKADSIDAYVAWKADAVCNWFAQHPDASAVAPMFKAISDDTGYNDTDTARVLVTAVGSTCPQYMPVLQRFVDLNPPAPTYKASGRIGGVLHG